MFRVCDSSNRSFIPRCELKEKSASQQVDERWSFSSFGEKLSGSGNVEVVKRTAHLSSSVRSPSYILQYK